jgi:hypothetical protein
VDTIRQRRIQGLNPMRGLSHVFCEKTKKCFDHGIFGSARVTGRLGNDKHAARGNHVRAHLAGELRMALEECLIEAQA